MKQLVKHSLLFVVFSLILYVAGFYLFYAVKYKGKPAIYVTNKYYTWKGGDTYSKFKEFSTDKPYDVVIIGSSRAYRSYSPYILEQLGYQAFNVGTSAQSIKNSYFILKHYLYPENCRLIILDVFAGAFTGNQLESSSDLVQNTSVPSAAYDIAFHNKDVRSLNIAMLRYLSENDTAYFLEQDYLGKGFSIKRDSLKTELKSAFLVKEEIRHKEFKLDQEQVTYLEQFLKTASDRKIKVILVYSPVSYFYNDAIHQPFLETILPIIKKYNYPFYDYSKCDSIQTDKHFYDESHLNQSGVEIFNRQLFQQLITDKVLTYDATAN